MSANDYTPGIRIRFELDHLKQEILHYLQLGQDSVSAEVKRQVEQYLTTEAIEAHIRNSVEKFVPQAIEKAVESFFSWGEGKRAIDSVVLDILKASSDEAAA